MATKKGLCKNVFNCKKADDNEIQEIEEFEDFKCMECGSPLEPMGGSEGSDGAKGGWKKWAIIGAAVVLVGGGAGFYFMQEAPQPSLPEVTETVAIVDSLQTATAEVKKEEPKEVPVIEEQKEKPVNQPQSELVNTLVSKDLGYAVWTGKVKNGKPHDVQGTLTFKSSHVIDSRDDKGRVAGPGDKVIGTFEDGHLVQGKWYKADNNIESIIIGGL